MKNFSKLVVIVAISMFAGCVTLTPVQRAQIKASHARAVVAANAATDAKTIAAAKHPALHPLTNSPAIAFAEKSLGTVAAVAFLAGIGLVAAGIWGGLTFAFRGAAIAFAVAAVSLTLAVFLKTVIVITGIVFVLAAVVGVAYALHKHSNLLADVEAEANTIADKAKAAVVAVEKKL